jgi:phosphoribosylamine--glycine ligase
VVLAAQGYPGEFPKGSPIDLSVVGVASVAHSRNHRDDTVEVFHMGTALSDGEVVVNGGRVLCVVAQGQTLAEARANAYAQVAKVNAPTLFHRTDIAAHV